METGSIKNLMVLFPNIHKLILIDKNNFFLLSLNKQFNYLLNS